MIERLDADIKAALLASDKDSAATLRMLKNALLNARIAKVGDLTEAEELQVIQKEAKQRKESIESFEAAGREELAARERMELEIISRYLPQALSEAELIELIDAAIVECKATTLQDLGAVMKQVQPQVAGRAEGSMVAALVRARLQ